MPVDGSEPGSEAMGRLIEALTQRIAELERQLQPKSSDAYDPHRLKPIDIKDIEKPDKYDNDITKFVVWYDRFRDLLMNRHPYWEYLLDAVEKQGKTKIHDHKEFLANLDVGDDEAKQSISRQEAQYCQQLKSYIRTYSTGELYARTTQTKSTEVLELMREIVHKGRIETRTGSLISKPRPCHRNGRLRRQTSTGSSRSGGTCVSRSSRRNSPTR